MRVLPTSSAARLSGDAVVEHFRSNQDTGLTEFEAKLRQDVYGRNEFTAAEEDPLWKKYLDQFRDPLIGMLLASAVVSLLMGQYDDAMSITAAIVIVVTVAFVQEYRSEKSLKEMNKLVPHMSNCLRDSRLAECSADILVPGDIVTFKTGDRIPADVRLLHTADLRVDESSLTGETTPIEKQAGVTSEEADASLSDRVNLAFMGTLVRSGNGKGIVTATGESSEFGAIFHMLQEVEQQKTPLQQNMDQLGKSLSIFSFAIIAVIMLIGLVQGRNMGAMFNIGVSLAVAAIPEGLPVVVTVTLALGVIRMAKQNAIVKKLPAVEALGAATVVCSDKTGTLTKNQMTATRVYLHAGHRTAKISGTGYSVRGEVTLGNDKRPSSTHTPGASRCMDALMLACNLCNDAVLQEDTVLGQATEGALLVAAAKWGVYDARKAGRRTKEIPFSSETKWMGVQVEHQGTLAFYVKGATFAVLKRCKSYSDEAGHMHSLTPGDLSEIETCATDMAKTGLRVIALAKGQDVSSLELLGLVGVLDPPREGARDAVSVLRRSGVVVTMITGDMQETAEAIGAEVGLFDVGRHSSLSGVEIDAMSAIQLQAHISNVRVFYRTSPAHKLSIVEAFQARDHVVAMTGDGINDAPALKLAEIGIAMGRTGTDVAKEAADMILVDDNIATILTAVEEGKCIAYNIRNFLRFQLSTSIAALSLIAISTLVGFENPLNAMQILWINILMDGPPAQSLGVEPVDPEVMQKPPRSRKEPIITRALIVNVLVAAGMIVSGTLFVFWRESVDLTITARDTTMTFTTFVCFDMFAALSCRSQTKSVFEIGLASNPTFLWAVGLSLLGQLFVIFFPPLQRVFQTEALYLADFVFIILVSSSVFVVDELRKFARRASESEQLRAHDRTLMV